MVLCCLISLFSGVTVPDTVNAATGTQIKDANLTDSTLIGQYQLNYTGNTNYYNWSTEAYNLKGGDTAETRKKEKERLSTKGHENSLKGYTNSSTSTLSNSYGGNGSIYKAYLVWQSRSDSANTVTMITPDKKKHAVKAKKKYNDERFGDTKLGDIGPISCMYCYAKDVTDLIGAKPYGTYSVCNIRQWGYDGHGGESMCAWQLIIVEKANNVPVRAVDLRMGSYFSYNSKDTVSMNLKLNYGIKTKNEGSGQVIYGFQSSTQSGKWPTTLVIGLGDEQILNNNTMESALYRNKKEIVSNQKITKFCLYDSATDGITIPGRVTNVKVTIENPNSTWNSYFLLGTAVDIDFPYTENMKTTVNSATSVTVSNTIKNTVTSAKKKMGIHSGTVTVQLDPALTAIGATATKSDKTALESSNISITNSNHTVTFSGIDTRTYGNKFSYVIDCSTDEAANRQNGLTLFTNRDSYSGKLYNGALESGRTETNQNMPDVVNGESTGTPLYTQVQQLYNVILHAGTGIDSVAGDGNYKFDSPVRIDAKQKPGYHWVGWTGTYQATAQDYQFTMPAQDVEMTANGEANWYKVRFDPNGGAEISHMDDILTQYDTDVTLPGIIKSDGTAAYAKYTLDGANVTQDVISGNTPQNRMAVYPSVFKGWSTEENKGKLTPEWKVGDVIRNLTEDENGTVTLYAIWDDCPWIQAEDLYYTLEQAQSGFVTDSEIMSHTTASDREDGSPILPGFHENGTSYSIPDYQATDFTQFRHEGSATENLTVVDSSGSRYAKQITIYIVDTTLVPVKTEGTTRFINEKYYHLPYQQGGLEDNSVWKTDPEYTAVLESSLEHLKDDTPQQTYSFTYEEILRMKEFIDQNGLGNTESDDALQRFYDRFMR